jgi:hypothetical protein
MWETQQLECSSAPAGAEMGTLPTTGFAPDRLSAILRSTRSYSPRAPPGLRGGTENTTDRSSPLRANGAEDRSHG